MRFADKAQFDIFNFQYIAKFNDQTDMKILLNRNFYNMAK